MGKLILIIAAFLLVYLILKSYQRGIDKRQPPDPSQRPMSGAGEDMVRCAQCGVHLPKSESITSRGEFFCCDEHRRQRLQ